MSWIDQYYLPLSEKDRFLLQLKDPTLAAFADWLTFVDTNKEVYVRRASPIEEKFVAVFNVKAGTFIYTYWRLENEFLYQNVSIETNK